MSKDGTVSVKKFGKKAELTFSHPKGNSLPGYLLEELTSRINQLAEDYFDE